MIFLVNRLGDVLMVGVEFLALHDEAETEELLRSCAWCPHWSTAAELARKRRRALELLRLK